MTQSDQYGPPAFVLKHWWRTNQLSPRYLRGRVDTRTRFAAGASAVAEGMLQLASTTSEYMAVIPAAGNRVIAPRLNLDAPARMVVLYNQHERRCACPVMHDEQFGPDGSFGLQAITVQAGTLRSDVVNGQVVLLTWHASDASLNWGTHRAFAFDLEGHAYVVESTLTPLPSRSLSHILGIDQLADAVTFSSQSGPLTDKMAGMTFAVDTMVHGLPKLKDHLMSLAEIVSPGHRCPPKRR